MTTDSDLVCSCAYPGIVLEALSLFDQCLYRHSLVSFHCASVGTPLDTWDSWDYDLPEYGDMGCEVDLVEYLVECRLGG